MLRLFLTKMSVTITPHIWQQTHNYITKELGEFWRNLRFLTNEKWHFRRQKILGSLVISNKKVLLTTVFLRHVSNLGPRVQRLCRTVSYPSQRFWVEVCHDFMHAVIVACPCAYNKLIGICCPPVMWSYCLNKTTGNLSLLLKLYII